MSALIQQMKDTFQTSRQNPQEIYLFHLHNIIVALGSIGKGFPESFGAKEKPWNYILVSAFELIQQILSQYQDQGIIRDAVRYALQRFISCMGSDILVLVLPVLKSELSVSNVGIKELMEFLNFVGLLVFKFKVSFCFHIKESKGLFYANFG